MHTLLRLFVFCCGLITCYSQAACEQSRPVQFIDIAEENEKIVIINKEQSKRCEIDNTNPQQTVQLKWVFQQLNCQPGECLIELAGGNANLPAGALECDIGNPNNRRCHLNIKKLQKYCDKNDTVNTDHCEITYDIKVRGEIIDPTIIIKPRPAAEIE